MSVDSRLENQRIWRFVLTSTITFGVSGLGEGHTEVTDRVIPTRPRAEKERAPQSLWDRADSRTDALGLD